VILVDPSSGRFLWRGVAQGMVDPGDAGSGQGKNVQAAIQKMFVNFPQ
jgi:hypothetical protein